ncbi:MAG: transposase [Myxococcales bacterium]|nr:transposase [Myxococcales bacterium]
MGRALRAIGARLGAQAHRALPWRKAKREHRLRALRRLAETASARQPVFYCDEVDIHLNPKIGRDWMLPGVQRRVVTPGKNHKAYIAGALDARTGQLVWVDAESKASWLFCKLLWRLVEQNPQARTIHLIVDNYVIHSSKVTREVLAHFADKIQLHFLPPLLPGRQPHRARLARPPRQCHQEPSLRHTSRVDAPCPTLPQ